MQEIVITGIGVILPGCDSRQRFWQQLQAGESQLTLEPDPTNPPQYVPMGRIHEFNPRLSLKEVPERYATRYPRDVQFYLASVLRAKDDAGLSLDVLDPTRIGVFNGSSRGSFAFWHERMRREHQVDLQELYHKIDLILGTPGQAASLAASLLKAQGPTYTFSNSCVSGAVAIGHAYKELLAGEIDVAIAGGHDAVLIAPLHQMYADAGLLTTEREHPGQAIRPYGGRSNNAFGEGAVSLVLETREHAERRGAPILAAVAGYKYGNNGNHPTHLHSSAQRQVKLLRSLLTQAHMTPDDIGFVVGHGNGVAMSDTCEINYMRAVFDQRASQVPLISTKPIYGHTLGASSAVNIAAAALMLHHQYLIPTINTEPALVEDGLNHQANQGEPSSSHAGIAMSFGLGGHNAAVLLRRASQGRGHERQAV